MARFDYDAFNSAPIEEVAKAAFRIVSEVQGERPETRAAAAAMVFLLLCDEFKTPPQDVFTSTKNMMANAGDGFNAHYAALRMYVANEARK